MFHSQENKFTLIEDLPNELFAQIFSHLNGIDAVFAFSPLHQCFEDLLGQYCKLFDFKFKSKLEFDTMFDEYSTKNWKSLEPANDNDGTPGQIEYCFEAYPLNVCFNQLESLSLLKMKSINESILFQILSLTNLISLKLDSVCGTIISGRAPP